MRGGIGVRLLLGLLIALAMASFASAQACCVDTTLGSCSDVPDQSQCDQTGQTFHSQDCSDVSDCSIGCCCDGTQSVGGTTNPEFKISCDSSQFDFVEAAETADCQVICGQQSLFFISGTVTDADDDSPISGAFVDVQGVGSTTTTSSGSYNIEVPQGTYDVTVSSSNCNSSTQSVAVNSDEPGTDFQLACSTGGGGGGGGSGTCSAGNANNIHLYSAQLASGALAIDLEWDINSTCDSTDVLYSIIRIDVATGLKKIGETSSKTFRDDGSGYALEQNTEYTYRVDAVFTDNTRLLSNTLTVDTGSDVCLGKSNVDFCHQNNVNRCNSQNQLELVTECSPKVCVETQSGALCRAQGPCEECNRLFGMYGSYDQLTVPYTTPQGQTINVACQDLISRYKVCYIDHSSTVVNPYKSCGDVLSCNAYSSENTCGADPCSANMDCEWSAVYGQQQSDLLGLGFCSDGGGLSCDQCSSLPGGCTETKCNELGDCIFSNGQCKPREELTCNDYRTQADCEGSPASPVVVDATYTSDVRSAGTHQITPSNDKAGLGRCYWFAGYCFKDADNKKDVDFPDDCVVEDTKCATDFVRPETSIDVHPDGVIGWNTMIQYTVSDNSYFGSGIKTYYCFETVDVDVATCYPDLEATGGGIISPVQGVGEVYMRYYSEDGAKNLEVVKTKVLNIDSDLPSISVTNDVTSTGGRSVLDVTIDVQDDTSPISCSWELIYDANSIGSGSGSGLNTYEDSFGGLEDGLYRFVVDCLDGAGNLGTEDIEIEVLGDTRINTFLPRGTFRLAQLQGVSLSVKTNSSATCRLDSFERMFSDMTNNFDITGGRTTHEEPLPSEVDGTKIYEYNIACSLDIGQVVQGNKAHVIKFAVDEAAPETIQQIDRTSDQGASIVTLTCSDSRTNLRDSNGRDMSFGCDGLYVCEGINCNPAAVGDNRTRVNFTEEGNYIVRYYSKDKGGNQQTVQTLNVEVDKTAPVFETVTISAPPDFFDTTKDALISAGNSGLVTGKVSPDTVEVCVENDNTDEELCIERCPGIGSHCITSTGDFTADFNIAETNGVKVNTLTLKAKDDGNNEGMITKQVISDRSGPAKPTLTMEERS